MERRLTVILSMDVVGYSRLTEADEEGTFERLAMLSQQVIEPELAVHAGRVFKRMGDGLLAEFASPVEALRCALALQTGIGKAEAEQPDNSRILYRIGLNLGDVLVEGTDLLGDGVNIAARLESEADPGGILLSSAVYEQVAGRITADLDDLGHRKLKNISHPVHTYRVRIGDAPSPVAAQPLFDFGGGPEKVPLVRGRCLCGHLSFEVTEAAVGSGYCHCRFCQRFTGAPAFSWTAFPANAVHFGPAAPKWFDSSPIARRGFCPQCGSALSYQLMKPEVSSFMVLSTMSLERPEDFAPTWHAGIESKMPWFDLADDLPRTACSESKDLQRAWASVGRPFPEEWVP
ncbi:MAG: GFA family protein [Leisingera sp.]